MNVVGSDALRAELAMKEATDSGRQEDVAIGRRVVSLSLDRESRTRPHPTTAGTTVDEEVNRRPKREREKG